MESESVIMKITSITSPIPPPVSFEELIKELKEVRNRRQNPVTPPKYSHILDQKITDIFNQIMINDGKPGYHKKIKNLKNEIKPVIYYYKNYYNQMRPNELAEEIGQHLDYDYLESAQTPSYPSGHTTQAFYLAHCLSVEFPSLSPKFFELAEMIAESRIDRGVHFPSDNEAGKLLAQYLFKVKMK